MPSDRQLEQIKIDLRANALDKRKAALDKLATVPAESALTIIG